MKTLTFDLGTELDLFSSFIASLQYHGVKYSLSRDLKQVSVTLA